MTGNDNSIYALLQAQMMRPAPFDRFDTTVLWTDPHISACMLEHHLDPGSDISSRGADKIDGIIGWLDRDLTLSGKRVLDLGCGPGLYARRMADRGAIVTGVDFSERSIAHARSTGGGITFLCRDYLRDPLPADGDGAPKHDVVTLIYGDICALPPDRRALLFAKIRAALAPGGVLILDAFSEPQFSARAETFSYAFNLMDGFWSAAPYFGFATTFLYPDLLLVLDRYLIVEAGRQWEVFNWLQYFRPADLGDELAAAGFQVERVVDVLTGRPWQDDATEFALVAAAP